jgi:hypothetical protein
MAKDSVHLSFGECCMTWCCTFLDCIDTVVYIATSFDISLKNPVAVDSFQVTEDLSVLYKIFWMFRVPMNTFVVEQVERDQIGHKTWCQGYVR